MIQTFFCRTLPDSVRIVKKNIQDPTSCRVQDFRYFRRSEIVKLTFAICEGFEVSTFVVLGTFDENCISTERFRVTDLASRANLLRPVKNK